MTACVLPPRTRLNGLKSACKCLCPEAAAAWTDRGQKLLLNAAVPTALINACVVRARHAVETVCSALVPLSLLTRLGSEMSRCAQHGCAEPGESCLTSDRARG